MRFVNFKLTAKTVARIVKAAGKATGREIAPRLEQKPDRVPFFVPIKRLKLSRPKTLLNPRRIRRNLSLQLQDFNMLLFRKSAYR